MSDQEVAVLRQLHGVLVAERDNAEKAIRSWIDKVQEALGGEHSSYPWTWADGAFQSAATHAVFSQVINAIDNWMENPEASNLTVGSLLDHASDELIRRGSRTSFSSSTTSNLVHRCEGAAWAQVRQHVAMAKAMTKE